MLIFTLIPHASWRFSSEKRDPLQHMSTSSKQKLRDATSLMMLQPSEFSSKDSRMLIYEKGPQTLTVAITEVEKLNAEQQLTAMIIPPSTINMMSLEKDYCFQCQEQGHIA